MGEVEGGNSVAEEHGEGGAERQDRSSLNSVNPSNIERSTAALSLCALSAGGEISCPASKLEGISISDPVLRTKIVSLVG